MQNNRTRVLVVDDDRSIEIALSTLLQLEGYEVACASNGEAGFLLYREFQPDIIVVDIMMPVIDGHQMVEKIRADSNGFNVKVVYLTAKGMELDKKEGYAKGCDEFITKPFSNDELLDVLASFNSRIKNP